MTIKPKISKQKMVPEVSLPSTIKASTSKMVQVMSNGCMASSAKREPVYASTDIRLKKIRNDKPSNLSQLGEDNLGIQKHHRPI